MQMNRLDYSIQIHKIIMNNKNFIIAFTLIAGVVLIQLVSKEQPNTMDNQKAVSYTHLTLPTTPYV